MTSSTTDASFLTAGRRVIRAEAAALEILAGHLDASFGQAVALILAAQGRLIVSGMGKSGHIARKIAATFASTGTPASNAEATATNDNASPCPAIVVRPTRAPS